MANILDVTEAANDVPPATIFRTLATSYRSAAKTAERDNPLDRRRFQVLARRLEALATYADKQFGKAEESDNPRVAQSK